MPFRRSKLLDIAESFGMAISDHVEHDGIWVGALVEADTINKVIAALDLVAANDPYRYRLIRREISRVWVHLLPGDSSDWVASQRRCSLDPRAVREGPVEQVAASMIHVATLARIRRLCVVSNDTVRRQAIDRVCARQERAFAIRLPNGQELRDLIDTRATQPAALWATRTLHERYVTGEADVAEYAGVPQWLVRLIHATRGLAKGRGL